MEVWSILCGSLQEEGIWGRMDPCICMMEFLHHLFEIITTLLIGYVFYIPQYKTKSSKQNKIDPPCIKEAKEEKSGFLS